MTGSARILRLRTEEAATALTSANHATFREPVTITDAYDLVGTLDELVRRLPQLFGFLSRAVERAQGPHYDDRGLDPVDAIRGAAHALDAATAGLELTVAQLATAHNHLGHIGRVHPED